MKEIKKINEETNTGLMAVADNKILPLSTKEFQSFQSIYEYYLNNVKKNKKGDFVIKYKDKNFNNQDINFLYEEFSKFITSNESE